MSILTLDDYLGSARQTLSFVKTVTRTTVALIPFSMFSDAGTPAGTLAVGNTANGIVPTDAIGGYPVLNAFGGGALGYVTRVEARNSVISNLAVYDCVFAAGAYAFNANTALASQPSYSGRVPGGTDYKGLEIWIEAVTAFTGNLSVAVTYTNQDGVAGRTTGTIATGAALIIGRMLQLPLQAGDTGVQKIESVVGTVATVGTFNVRVMRKVTPDIRIGVANESKILDFLATGAPQVWETSALFFVVQADSTSSGLPYIRVEVANK